MTAIQRLPGTDKGYRSSEHSTRSKIAESLDGLFFIFMRNSLLISTVVQPTVLTPASSRATLMASSVSSQHLGQLPSQSGQH